MAITNAQQYQQLVNKPANGKRPGYRGDAAYGKTSGSAQAKSFSKATSSNSAPTKNDYQGPTGPSLGDGDASGTTVTYDPQKALDTAKKAGAFDKKYKSKKSKTFNPFPIATAALDKLNNSKLAKFNNRFQRNNYLRSLNADQQVALLEALAEEEGIGTDNPMGIDRNIQRGMGTYNYLDPEQVDKGFLGTGIGAGKFVTDIEFGGEDAKDTINEAMTQYNEDLASGLLDNDASVVLGDDQPGLTYDEYLDSLKTSTGGGGGGGQQQDPCKGPNPPAYCKVNNDDEEEVNPRDYTGLAPRFMGSSFDFTGLAEGGIARAGAMDGGRMRQMEMMQDEDDPTGGIMDLESGRQMYFLGKLVKKAGRAIKKVVKSPIGKAALLYFGAGALGNLAGGSGLGGMFKGAMSPSKFLTRSKLGNIFTKDGAKNILFGGQKLMGNPAKNNFVDFSGILGSGGKSSLGKTLGLSFGLPFALDALGVGKDDDKKIDLDEYRKTAGLGGQEGIDAIRLQGLNKLADRFRVADGGRINYQEGGDAEPVAKKTMPLLDMDGMEKDYREDGGFVPIGRMERADDVPARLSKNEFVFTADAVRNAGDGDIDKGAEVMYNMMKNLESGGEVSEESQGLDGAKEMFKTSQRLEEVL
jgi:hypothetical protein